MGWGAIGCITGLMAFLQSITSQTDIHVFFGMSVLTMSFHLNFGLRQDVGLSTLKFMIFFVHDVSC